MSNYTYKICKGTKELSVYRDKQVVCFITDSMGNTLEDKIKYFNKVFKS